jgi:hypothetical protein
VRVSENDFGVTHSGLTLISEEGGEYFIGYGSVTRVSAA